VGFLEIEDNLKDRIVFTPDYTVFKIESIVELFGINDFVMN